MRRDSRLGGAAQAQARARAGGGVWERFLAPGGSRPPSAPRSAAATARGKAPLAAPAPAAGKENSAGAAPLLAG